MRRASSRSSARRDSARRGSRASSATHSPTRRSSSRRDATRAGRRSRRWSKRCAWRPGVDEAADSRGGGRGDRGARSRRRRQDAHRRSARPRCSAPATPGTTEETFWAIRRLMETAAQNTPVVLVLDDLHWAEPLMLDLVEHLAEWTRTSPVLLVVTGRPELRDIRPSLAQPGRVLDVISLEGLDGRATEALACGLLGTDRVPSELLARLPESTEGNPLFVREFVRMLVDDGVLRTDGRPVGHDDQRRRDRGAADDPLAARRPRRTAHGARTDGARARVGRREGVLPRRDHGARAGRGEDGPRRAPREPAAQGARRAGRDVLDRRARVPVPPRADPRRGVPPAAQGVEGRAARARRGLARAQDRRPARRAPRARSATTSSRRTSRAGSSAPWTITGASSRRARVRCCRPRRAWRSTGTTSRRRRRCPAARSNGSRTTRTSGPRRCSSAARRCSRRAT